MKKTIVRVLILTIFISIIFINFSMAVDFSKADAFIEKGSDPSNNKISNLTTVGAQFSAIGNVLKYIGAGIIVAGTAYMGIMYMISPPERQAKLKQQLIGLVVSAVVIFGGYYIWKIIVTALDSIMS